VEPKLKDGSVGDNSDDTDLERLAEMALEYLRPWIKNSRRLSLNQTEKWKLLEDLYHNRRDLASWNTRETKISSAQSFQGAHSGAGESDAWGDPILFCLRPT
jgi:hypothetical protein